jgi:hypothetical protein
MKWLQGMFTQRYNARHKQWGHLFQSRYKAKVVDAGRIDLQRTDLAVYPWSSFSAQIGARGVKRRFPRPVWTSQHHEQRVSMDSLTR